MPSRFDKICIMCGKHHKYCGHCDDYKHLEPWHENFDNDNCHTIFNLIMNYRTGMQTPAECKEAMEECDLSYRERFSDGMNAFITAILSENNGTEETEEVAEENEVPEVKMENAPAVDHEENKTSDEKGNKPQDNYRKFSSNKKMK